jgi:glyoxylase-like metal-dependent hydrolase (beta-lactamase superfamily II)
LRRIEALGFRKEDVRHLLVTHMDFDHAGGIADFPHAEVHLFADEHAALTRSNDPREKYRYSRYFWSRETKFRPLPLAGERWRGFDAVRAPLPGLDVLLVPLGGHTRGHAGVAVRSEGGWLLHCGDAYFHYGEMEARPACPPGLAVFQAVTAYQNQKRLANQARLRALKAEAGTDIQLFCAHDPSELARMQRRAQIRAGR